MSYTLVFINNLAPKKIDIINSIGTVESLTLNKLS